MKCVRVVQPTRGEHVNRMWIVGGSLLALLMGEAAQAGARAIYEERDIASGDTHQAMVEVQNARVRLGPMDESQGGLILNGQTLWIVDPYLEQVIEVSEESVAELRRHIEMSQARTRAQMSAAQSGAAHALENLPEAVRERAAALMAQQQSPVTPVYEPPPAEVVVTEDQRNIGKFPCTRFELRREEEVVRVVWATSVDEVEGALEIGDGLQRIYALVGMLSEQMSGGAVRTDNPLENWDFSRGIPVEVVTMADGKPASKSRLISLELADIEAERFARPEHMPLRTPVEGYVLPTQ